MKIYFLALSQLKVKKLNPPQEDDHFLKVLHHCNVKGMASRITCEKVLKAFSLEPHVMSTQNPLGATRQEKLSTLVKTA